MDLVLEAGTAGGGGGGGAPGNVLQFIQPAYLVPDVLYMTVAKGGAGGAASTAGGYPLVVVGYVVYNNPFI